jgi:glucose-1-phosphate cytidylyltransferase
MKTVLLAGGLGTRISEETQLKPKPMVEIGGVPILVHIMRTYCAHNFNRFIVALGYKGEVVKDYFINYHLRKNDISINTSTGQVEYQNNLEENMLVELIDTGNKAMTGGRLLRLKNHLITGGTFMLTYGDGVSDVNITSLIEFHKSHGKIATLTAVRPAARFGTMSFDGDSVSSFKEKSQASEGWINGGYFVFEPKVFDYLIDDTTVLEKEPLENLANDGELMAYKHNGFWHPMDTVRDRDVLNEMCALGRAPWSVSSELK